MIEKVFGVLRICFVEINHHKVTLVDSTQFANLNYRTTDNSIFEPYFSLLFRVLS